MKGMHVGLLIGHEGVLHDAFPLEIFNMAVVVEETIVLHDIRDVPTGFAMLMGTIHCLNLEYPHAMKYSFEFLQRVIMKIKSHQCSARIHGLRSKLLRGSQQSESFSIINIDTTDSTIITIYTLLENNVLSTTTTCISFISNTTGVPNHCRAG
ncbi:uncharacterized protein AKAME5_001982400 [Lates japonicus]|uniref:Uncharacterized protein n=1 Tax=Lates japonicus TaxID=270547 RepID=A0AAD3NBW9_LATJO|nr:uncharacterized protein AKAME5_001982400 [Lates japonicus]